MSNQQQQPQLNSIEVGDSGVSFDDLDAIETMPEKPEVEEIKEEIRANDDEIDKIDADGKKIEPEKEEKPKEEEKHKEEAPKEEEKPKKGIKASIDGKEIDLDPKAMVKVKVAGEIIEMPLKDVINKASGEIAVEKKFTEVDKKNKEAEAKLGRYQEQVKTTAEHLKKVVSGLNSDNPLDGLKYLVELSNGNYYNVHNSLFNSLYKEFEQVYEMDEVERKAFFLERENNFLKESKKSEVDRLQQSQAEKERFDQLNQQREAAGVTEEEFVSALEELKEAGVESDFNTVVQYAHGAKVFNKAQGIVKSINVDLASDNEFVIEVAKLMNDPSLSEQDIKDIVNKAVVVPESVTKEIEKKSIPDDSFRNKIVKTDEPDMF